MRYCVKCGAKLLDEAKFCTECGSPQKTTFQNEAIRVRNDYNNENTQAIPTIREMPNRMVQEEDHGYSDEGILKSAVIGVIIGVVVLFIGFTSYYVYTKVHKSPQTPIVNTNTVDSSNNVSTDSSSTSKDIEETDKTKDNTKNSNNAANTNSKSDEYMFKNSGNERLEDSQVSSLSKENLAIARNEIYARHGFVFQTEPFKTYFNNKAWYKPNSSFKGSDEELSSVEKANVDLILKYENK
ncbi:YARHG domain-containing protein [Clostridium muellerianum]|nr:YARHG domain-containing protein [Clostridium muellerianum]